MTADTGPFAGMVTGSTKVVVTAAPEEETPKLGPASALRPILRRLPVNGK